MGQIHNKIKAQKRIFGFMNKYIDKVKGNIFNGLNILKLKQNGKYK